MNFQFSKFSKFFLFLFLFLSCFSLTLIFNFKLKLGIDFKGGSIIEIQFEERVDQKDIERILKENGVREVLIEASQGKSFFIKTEEISSATFEKIISQINEKFKIKNKNFESISPTLSKELSQKSTILVILSIFVLLFYIVFSFSKIKGEIKNWHYGLTTVLVLLCDLSIVFGFLAVLTKFFNFYFTIPIVVALLTILGYGINDKIVVFDRIRENLTLRKREPLSEIINKSLNQVFGRSINTSFTTILPLGAIILSGEKSLYYFCITLIFGILVSTFSSLFFTPFILELLVRLFKRK